MAFNLSDIKKVFNEGTPAKDYVTRGCLAPRVLHINNSFGINIPVTVDCGHCIRCQDALREEWATRMFLHSQSSVNKVPSYWRYCYFVTLTYGTYDLNPYKQHPFLTDWLATYPSCDNTNYNHHYTWGPSVLVRSHVQKYLKRLRFVLRDRTFLSYAYCGEYGHDYGRPHWHLIVWSSVPIDYDVFSSAWGYYYNIVSPTELVRARSSANAQFFKIGNVEVEDLIVNGSFSEGVNLHGSKQDAIHCFTYLAKYVRKSTTDSISPATYRRMSKAFLDLPFDRSVDLDPDRPFVLDNRILTYNNKVIPNVDFNTFKKVYSPCFASSSSYSLGKQYFFDHIEEFEKGCIRLPKFRNKRLQFPRYYSHLLALKKNPFRFEKCVISGRTLCKGDSRLVYDYYKLLSKDPYSVSASFASGTVRYNRHCLPFEGVVNLDYISLKSPNGTFRGVLNTESMMFDFYQFDRSSREYVKVIDYDIPVFCEMVCDTLLKERDKIIAQEEDLKLRERFIELMNSSPDCIQEREDFILKRKKMQKDYDSNHNFLPV